jgi:hypothetical protein
VSETLTIDLGSDESSLASYKLPSDSSLGKQVILTNKRLVFVAGSARESHPLSRIRAIRIETRRNWFYFIAFTACAGVGLATALMVGVMQVMASYFSHPDLTKLMIEGYVFGAVGLILGLSCLWGARMTHRGYTLLVIDLESRLMTYAVQAQDPALLAFVTKVEHAL